MLAELAVTWFSKARWAVLDPFAGDSVSGFVAASLKRRFTGLEIRPEQAALNQARLDAARLKGSYHALDAAAMDSLLADGSQDLLFTCPPYWNLERYGGPAGDLSGLSWPAFQAAYSAILAKAAGKLRANRFAVLVVGELRHHGNGRLVGLVPLTIAAMTAAGLTYHNELVLLQPAVTAPLRAGTPMQLNRRVTRTHQSVLVFYKGSPAAIRSELGPVRPSRELVRHVLAQG